MRWTDGSVYIGEWIRGIQHGYGKIIFPDGTEKEGYFEDNIYVGPIPREVKGPALTMKDMQQKNMILSPSSLARIDPQQNFKSPMVINSALINSNSSNKGNSK